MPALFTHDFFGQDAFGSAIDSVSLYTPDERDAFLLGCQGPDPLFYLVMLPPLEVFRKLGARMHSDGPSALLVAMRKATDALPAEQQPVGRAYLAGFVCHYLLDSTVHPLVYFWERGICQAGVLDLDANDASAVHAEVERDLDEMVLYTKRNQTIEAYRPHEEVLRGKDEVLNTIGAQYFMVAVGAAAGGEPTASRVYPIAVSCYRRALYAMWSPNGAKADVLGRLELIAKPQRYSVVRAMSYRPRAEITSDFDNRERRLWRDPFTDKVRTESFWDLYDAALMRVRPALAAVFADDFDQEKAHALTGGLNFSGEPVEQ